MLPLWKSLVRGFLSRQKLKQSMGSEIDNFLQIPGPNADYKPQLKPAFEVFKVTQEFLFTQKFLLIRDVHSTENIKRFEYLCRYILASIETDSLKTCYVSVSLNKQLTLSWIAQLKEVLWLCCQHFHVLKPEKCNDMKSLMVFLRMLITFTTHTNWVAFRDKEALHPGFTQLCNNIMGDLNGRGIYPALGALLRKGLCRSKIVLSKAALTAIITMSLRPLVAANFSHNLMSAFVLHIVSVPAVVLHVNSHAQDCLAILVTHRIFKRCLDLLTCEQSTRIIFNSLEGIYALCLMAT